MNAEEFYRKTHNLGEGMMLSNKAIDEIRIIQAYHESRVNAISDDKILLSAIQQDGMNEQISWGDGAKWFKEQLLKQ